MVTELEDRAASFEVMEWWDARMPTITEIAIAGVEHSGTVKDAKLHNPYDGLWSARQLTETVNEFLERLPPATTPASDVVDWIYIANPYRKAERTARDSLKEGPAEDERDLGEFVRRGTRYLEELMVIKNGVEKANMKKSKGEVTRAFNKEKDAVVK